MEPNWFDEEVLHQLISLEKRGDGAGLYDLNWKLPEFYFFEIAIILFRDAFDDITKGKTLRTLIEDLYELRIKKLIETIKSINFKGQKIKQLSNITNYEVNMIRAYTKGLPVGFALDALERDRNQAHAADDLDNEEAAYDNEF